jgi:LysM repeat protein
VNVRPHDGNHLILLIYRGRQDLSLRRPLDGRVKGIQALFKQSYTRTIALRTLLFLAIATPFAYTHAEAFSFVSDLFAAHAQVKVRPRSLNSQTIPLLRAALNADPNPSKGGGGVMVVGGTALVSEVGPSGTLANIEKNVARLDQISLYVVREGDSLAAIANMFGVSKNTIIWANDIKRGSLITTGQTLVILPVSGVTHAVRKGDTLASIAKKYSGDVEEITSFNNLESGATLAVGTEIIIPDGEMALPTPRHVASKSNGASSAASSGYYVRPVVGVKTQGIHGYNGVDIAAPAGTPIVAAASGDVLVARSGGWNGGYGDYIVLKHNNGTQTLYAHNSNNIVAVGESVVQGQIIGYVGSTGKSTGNHVHFEVRGATNPF